MADGGEFTGSNPMHRRGGRRRRPSLNAFAPVSSAGDATAVHQVADTRAQRRQFANLPPKRQSRRRRIPRKRNPTATHQQSAAASVATPDAVAIHMAPTPSSQHPAPSMAPMSEQVQAQVHDESMFTGSNPMHQSKHSSKRSRRRRRPSLNAFAPVNVTGDASNVQQVVDNRGQRRHEVRTSPSKQHRRRRLPPSKPSSVSTPNSTVTTGQDVKSLPDSTRNATPGHQNTPRKGVNGEGNPPNARHHHRQQHQSKRQYRAQERRARPGPSGMSGWDPGVQDFNRPNGADADGRHTATPRKFKKRLGANLDGRGLDPKHALHVDVGGSEGGELHIIHEAGPVMLRRVTKAFWCALCCCCILVVVGAAAGVGGYYWWSKATENDEGHQTLSTMVLMPATHLVFGGHEESRGQPSVLESGNVGNDIAAAGDMATKKSRPPEDRASQQQHHVVYGALPSFSGSVAKSSTA